MIGIPTALALASPAATAQIPANPTALVREGMDAREAVKITDSIYQAVGFGNTYMVITPAGNVIIDTSSPAPARLHVKLLKEKRAAPVKYIWPGDYGAKIDAAILFDDKYEFTLGGVKFEIYSTPGETPDHLSVWIPQWKAAFTGDDYVEAGAGPPEPWPPDSGKRRDHTATYSLSQRDSICPRRSCQGHERRKGRLHIDARNSFAG